MIVPFLLMVFAASASASGRDGPDRKSGETAGRATSSWRSVIPIPSLGSSEGRSDAVTPAVEKPVRLEAFGFESTESGGSGRGEAVANETEANVTSAAAAGQARAQFRRIKCACRTGANDSAADGRPDDPNVVHLVDGSHLMHIFFEVHNPNVTNRTVAADCHLVMFYAEWCPFSAAAAPHFNALARLYPDITLLAVDSSQHQGINTQFGVLALPTLVIFHNTKPISKFNHSEYTIQRFVSFVDAFTTLKAVGDVAVTNGDLEGPLPTKATVVTDYYLWLAWLFTIVCAIGYFGKSSLCARIAESIRNNWREAEIQHEHID